MKKKMMTEKASAVDSGSVHFIMHSGHLVICNTWPFTNCSAKGKKDQIYKFADLILKNFDF